MRSAVRTQRIQIICELVRIANYQPSYLLAKTIMAAAIATPPPPPQLLTPEDGAGGAAAPHRAVAIAPQFATERPIDPHRSVVGWIFCAFRGRPKFHLWYWAYVILRCPIVCVDWSR